MNKLLTTKKSPKSKRRGLPCSKTLKTAQRTVYRGYEGLFLVREGRSAKEDVIGVETVPKGGRVVVHAVVQSHHKI